MLAVTAAQAQDNIPGGGLYNTGNGFVWTGVGILASTATMFAVEDLHSRIEHKQHEAQGRDYVAGTPVYPLFALAGLAVGGLTTVSGLVMRGIGKGKMKNNGFDGYEMVFTGPGQRGFSAIVDAGIGLAPALQFNAAFGYHFNEYLFVGPGIGAVIPLYDDSPTAKMFVDTRVSFSRKKVSPFVAFDLGAVANGYRSTVGLYGGLTAGARIHHSDKHSLWLGSMFDFSPKKLISWGLKAGYSF